MAQSKAERLEKVHSRCIREFDRAYEPQQEVRLQCLEDRRFCYVPGAQWEGDLERQFAERPRFEVNKVHLSVIRIMSEYRNNRITVDFRPKDDEASEATADLLDGLYRADENDCNANEAYDNAFEEGVAGGMGAWRLRNVYEDEYDDDDDRQRIIMEPIFDADSSVFFDIDAKRQDKADAKRCWVIWGMSRSAHEDKYGPVASFGKVQRLTYYDWFTPDVAYIAEYYEVEEVNDEVYFFMIPGTDTQEKRYKSNTNQQYLDVLRAQGFILARTKKFKRKKVHKYIVDGNSVLEDCGYIAGCEIPIIPFYAKRQYVDNVERIMGHVRLAKDLQRIYNMEVSALTETSALSQEEKPVFTPGQIQGHENRWAEDNVKRYPYLLINPTIDPSTGIAMPAQMLNYTKARTIPPAVAGLIQLTDGALKEATGNQQVADEIKSNISAKTVESFQERVDMQTFIYTDNFAKAMRRSGVVWRSMMKENYDEEGRTMQTMGLEGDLSDVAINKPKITDGMELIDNDVRKGKYSVIVDTGPSFTTRRDKTVRAITNMLNFVEDPTLKSALVNMAISNMEGEGLEDLKTYLRKQLVMAGIVTPNEEEKAMLQASAENQKPDANTQFLIAAAGKEEALAQKAKADTIETLTTAEKNQADTAKILNGIGLERLDQLVTGMERFLAMAQQSPQTTATNAAPVTTEQAVPA